MKNNKRKWVKPNVYKLELKITNGKTEQIAGVFEGKKTEGKPSYTLGS